MERKQEGYKVVIFTKRLPGSFKVPVLLRKFLSTLSELPNAEIGSDWNSMSLEKAEEIAKNNTSVCYTDGQNHLRSSRGVVVEVR